MGACTRASLKAIDGTYLSPFSDAVTGALMGSLAQFPIGEGGRTKAFFGGTNKFGVIEKDAAMAIEKTILPVNHDLSHEMKETAFYPNSPLRNPRALPSTLDAMSEHASTETLIAIAKHRNTSPETLNRLAKDMYPSVRQAVAEHSQTADGTLFELSFDRDQNVRTAVANNPNTNSSILKRFYYNNDYFTHDIAETKLRERGFDILPGGDYWYRAR